VPLVVDGNVHSDRITPRLWRIPLPGRLVGLAVPSDHLERFGDDAEEQFDARWQRSHDSAWAHGAKRITPVVNTTISFVDGAWGRTGRRWATPASSSTVPEPPDRRSDARRTRFEDTVQPDLRASIPARPHLHRVVEHYYDGWLFTLFQVGEYVR
jgi:hypothetical protein